MSSAYPALSKTSSSCPYLRQPKKKSETWKTHLERWLNDFSNDGRYQLKKQWKTQQATGCANARGEDASACSLSLYPTRRLYTARYSAFSVQSASRVREKKKKPQTKLKIHSLSCDIRAYKAHIATREKKKRRRSTSATRIEKAKREPEKDGRSDAYVRDPVQRLLALLAMAL